MSRLLQYLQNNFTRVNWSSTLNAELSESIVHPNRTAALKELLHPFKGDPTSKFINISTVFVILYGADCLLFGHHDHQDVQYPYMKSKRRTLAYLFEEKENASH
eukprot:gene4046-5064_t